MVNYLLYSGGHITLNNITSSPLVTNLGIPSGMIIADNTVASPQTTYNSGTSSWTTRVPLAYSSSNIFISAAIVNSSNGFVVAGGKNSVVNGNFYSNTAPFNSSWFYSLSCYQPQFNYASVAGTNQVLPVNGGGQATGTPTAQTTNLVAGGSGGGGSNYTGSNSSTKNYTTCSARTLAIEEVSFKIKQTNTKNILAWRIDATSDVNYFEPEFSEDGDQFKSLGEIRRSPSVISGYQSYTIDHPVEKNGKYYYRLKLKGDDQTISYSKIIRVNVNYFKPIIFPNPTTGEITISNLENNSRGNIEIKDMAGRSVKNILYTKNQKLDIRNLTPGIYTIIISDPDNLWVEKVIKQ